MAPSRDDNTPASHQAESPRLNLWLGDVPTLGDVADGMLHRLKHQNSALEKLREALDENFAEPSRAKSPASL
jgi:hypothetical protein